jgi:hypothetical protein
MDTTNDTSQQKQARMWQLVRVMSKMIPGSREFLPRRTYNLSKQDVLTYLNKTLGESTNVDGPPYPTWGESWDAFLARLATWVLDSTVTAEQMERCMLQGNNMRWTSIREPLVFVSYYFAYHPLILSHHPLILSYHSLQHQSSLPWGFTQKSGPFLSARHGAKLPM